MKMTPFYTEGDRSRRGLRHLGQEGGRTDGRMLSRPFLRL